MSSQYVIKATVDTSQAERNLDNLKNSVQRINDSFANLRNAIASIALGGLIQQAIAFADAASDIADATDLALANVLEFTRAVEASGGSIEGAQKGLLKFVQSIGEAGDKSNETREAFYKVGVTLQDLKTLSNQDLLKKVIDGLGRVEDSSEAARIKTQLFNKEFAKVSGQNLAKTYDDGAASSQKYAAAVASAAGAQGKLEFALREFQLRLLAALQPITEFIEKLDPKSIQNFLDTVVNLGKALVILYAASKLTGIILALGQAFNLARLAGGGLAGAITGLSASSGVLKNLGEAFSLLRGAVMNLSFTALLGGLLRLIPVVAAAYAGFEILRFAIKQLADYDIANIFDDAAAGLENLVRSNLPAVADFLDKIGKALGMADAPSKQREAAAAAKKLADENKKAADEAARLKREAQFAAEMQKRLKDETEKFGLTLRQQVSDYSNNLDLAQARFELEKTLVGLSNDEAEIKRFTAQLDTERLAKERAIVQEIEKLTLERKLLKESDVEQNAALTERIRLLTGQKAELNQVFEAQSKGVIAALRAAQVAKEQLADSLRYIKLNEELKKQATAYDQIRQAQSRISESLRYDLEFQIRKLTMSEDEIEIAEALNRETERYIQLRDELGNKLTENFNAIAAEQRRQHLLTGEELKDSEDRVTLLERENEEIRKTIDTSYEGHMRNGRVIEENLGRLQKLRFEEKQRQADLEYNTKLLEAQFKTQESLADILRNINDKKVELRFEQSLDKLSPLQKRIAEIQENARKAAVEAGRAFAGSFEEEDGLSPERAEQLAEGLRAIAQGFKDIATQQIDAITQFKTFQELLEENFKAYAEDALDSNKQIKDSFENTVKGLEDAFVKFALTGKLSFQDMANSILADLARIAVRRAIVFAGSALFGLPIPGRAEGGPVDARSPYVVGERGPELFIPNTAGKIVPNAQLGGEGMGQGGATTVTYNINAVDAASFRALVARDPSFIYSVTEQGRRNTPSRSR